MKNQFISGNLSFASGGDGETDTLDYVAYVAKVHYIYYLSIYKSLTTALFSYSWIAKLVEMGSVLMLTWSGWPRRSCLLRA